MKNCKAKKFSKATIALNPFQSTLSLTIRAASFGIAVFFITFFHDALGSYLYGFWI